MILTRPIGIDLGTTNSAVAMLDLNERDLVLCRDAQGRTTTPSCVWCDPGTGRIEVGHRAFARKGTLPEPITSIKRAMGTRLTVELGAAHCSAAEVSAHILAELKRQMETELERLAPVQARYEVSRAIVTVPAYFDLPAIEATREAGRLAGLDVAELLHEPTAAAIYHGWKHDLGDGVYMVYDLGGGTFDVSVLRRVGSEFLVLGISGDNFLGGDDFDRRLAEHIRTLAAEEYELDLDVAGDPEDHLRFRQLMALAETAKKALSAGDEFILRSDGAIRDKAGTPMWIELRITRETFEGLIEDLLERTVACCNKALARARASGDVGLDDVDHVLLVGGSTHVPAVMEKVRAAFCDTAAPAPIRDEPETSVAYGAALRAATSGLGVCDEGRRARVWLRGFGTTRRERVTISGWIEPLEPGLALAGGRLALGTSADEPLGDVALGDGLTFAFPGVPLEAETVNDFTLSLRDAAGAQIALVGRSIAHDAGHRQAVGGTLSPAVLAKPIVLEGTDGDRLVRTVLMAEGTALPAKAAFTFAVADTTGQIRLPLYQANRVIKELRASVGDVRPGTPAEIALACDEQVNITVECTVAGHAFGGSIEPPPPDSVPSEYDVEEIGFRFVAALEPLDAGDAARLQGRFATLMQDLREARAAADHPKVIQRAADLEGLVRDARRAAPLQPPLATLRESYESCAAMVPRAAEVSREIDATTLQEHLDALLASATAAYEHRDRDAYEDAARALDAALHYLTSVASVTETDIDDDTLRARLALDRTRQMLMAVLMSAAAHGSVDRVPDVEQYLHELDQLEAHLPANAVAVGNRCQVLQTEARRIYDRLVPQDAMRAEIAGLLRVGTTAGGEPDLHARGLFGRGR